MTTTRIALANLSIPASREAAVDAAVSAIAEAGQAGALILCFPECFIPGYRWPGAGMPPPDAGFLEKAIQSVASAAKAAGVAVILGTERITEHGLQIAACVMDADGEILGWQYKGQLDPEEESIYPVFGSSRKLFTVGPLCFGVVICHEGWRYPETVRWAARRGAQVVFHPHAAIAGPGSYRPQTFADPAGSFHEMAVRCRAAENTIYFASVNCASDGVPISSAIAAPDGSLLCYQPHGQPGLLVADVDLSTATGLLAQRCRTSGL